MKPAHLEESVLSDVDRQSNNIYLAMLKVALSILVCHPITDSSQTAILISGKCYQESVSDPQGVKHRSVAHRGLGKCVVRDSDPVCPSVSLSHVLITLHR